MSDAARHPYRLTDARQLASADAARHVADLVRLVLLTGPNERLHHPELGAGLGTGALFEPLDGALASIVEVRTRGSLERALCDRIEVLELAVARTGETTIEADVTYRLRGAADARTVTVTVDG
jgi:Bacteriophage baseplate protein W